MADPIRRCIRCHQPLIGGDHICPDRITEGELTKNEPIGRAPDEGLSVEAERSQAGSLEQYLKMHKAEALKYGDDDVASMVEWCKDRENWRQILLANDTQRSTPENVGDFQSSAEFLLTMKKFEFQLAGRGAVAGAGGEKKYDALPDGVYEVTYKDGENQLVCARVDTSEIASLKDLRQKLTRADEALRIEALKKRWFGGEKKRDAAGMAKNLVSQELRAGVMSELSAVPGFKERQLGMRENASFVNFVMSRYREDSQETAGL